MSMPLKRQSNTFLLVLLLSLLFPLLSSANQVYQMTSIATLSDSTVAKSTLPETSPVVADSTDPAVIGIHDELEVPPYEDDADWFNISDSNSLLPRQDIPCPDGAAVCADNWIISSPYGRCNKGHYPGIAHFENLPYTICCGDGIKGATKRDPLNTRPEYGAPGWKCCNDWVTFKDCELADSVTECLTEVDGKTYNNTKIKDGQQWVCFGGASSLGRIWIGLAWMLAFWTLFITVTEGLPSANIVERPKIHALDPFSDFFNDDTPNEDVDTSPFNDVDLNARNLNLNTNASDADISASAPVGTCVQDPSGEYPFCGTLAATSPYATCDPLYQPLFAHKLKSQYTVCCNATYFAASTVFDKSGFSCCHSPSMLICERARSVVGCVGADGKEAVEETVEGVKVCKGEGEKVHDLRKMVVGLGWMGVFWGVCVGSFWWL